MKQTSLGIELLKMVVGATDFAIRHGASPRKFSMNFQAVLEHRRFRNVKVAKQTVRRLINRGYLTESKKKADTFISLTEKGQAIAVVACMKRRPPPRLPKGSCCIVIYDFPESARFARDAFRHLLKELGFKCLHESAWINNRDHARHLRYFIEINDAEKWINIFIGREVDSFKNSRP